MDPLTILPDKEISGGGTVSDVFLSMGIHRFLDACRFVHHLPYGYNTDKDDLMILFRERMGTCTTKHATIAILARELGLPVFRCVGIYPMTEEIVAGAGRIAVRYQLPYVPMIHCFLEHHLHRVDLTEGNRNGKKQSIEVFLFTQRVEPDISTKAEYLIYRNALTGLVQSRQELGIHELLRAREEGLKVLRANVEP
jgi:hypothetical protein